MLLFLYRDIPEAMITGDYVLKKKKHKRKLSVGEVRVVFNSNDKEISGTAYCYYASLI